MKRLLTGTIVFLGLIAGGTILQANEHPAEHPIEKKAEKSKVEAVTSATPFPKSDQLTITGTVLCTSCDLKKQKGAKSQCSVYGHDHTLKVSRVIQVIYGKDGKPVMNKKGQPSFKYGKKYIGKIYHILKNDSSIGLLKDEYKGKEVIIVGKIYPDENVVEVDFVKLAPPEKKHTEHPKKSEHPEHPE